jgi:Protein kinase domain
MLAETVIHDRYRTTVALGEGAFGRTFAAQDTHTGQDVVLKQVPIRGQAGWKPVEYFEREVKVLRSLNHPGVPHFVDAFQADIEGSGPSLVLVMERIPGSSLLEYIQRGHRWEEAAARGVLAALLTTLAYLHGLSPPVIHRDIKPANVMVRPDGRPVLVDFGAVGDWTTRVGHGSLTVAGTVGYMSPEQAMGAAGPASDLFALGATMVHALTHCHPADLPRRGLRLLFHDRLGCSADLVAVLEKLVAPDVSERYASAAFALADLQRPPGSRQLARRPRDEQSDDPPPRALVRLNLPAAPRALTTVSAAYLNGQATLNNIKAAGTMATVFGAGTLMMYAAGGLTAVTVVAAGVLATGIGGVLAGWMNRAKRRLYRDGVAVQGQVCNVQRESAGDEMFARVLYEFEAGGRAWRGELDASGRAARVVQENDPVLVIHHPRRPGTHIALLAGR